MLNTIVAENNCKVICCLLSGDNPYKKVYRSRTERILLNSYRIRQQLLEQEYAANLLSRGQVGSSIVSAVQASTTGTVTVPVSSADKGVLTTSSTATTGTVTVPASSANREVLTTSSTATSGTATVPASSSDTEVWTTSSTATTGTATVPASSSDTGVWTTSSIATTWTATVPASSADTEVLTTSSTATPGIATVPASSADKDVLTTSSTVTVGVDSVVNTSLSFDTVHSISLLSNELLQNPVVIYHIGNVTNNDVVNSASAAADDQHWFLLANNPLCNQNVLQSGSCGPVDNLAVLNTNELLPYIESATFVNVTPTSELNPLFNQGDLPSGSCGPDGNLASPNTNELLPYIETPTSSGRELMNNPLFNQSDLQPGSCGPDDNLAILNTNEQQSDMGSPTSSIYVTPRVIKNGIRPSRSMPVFSPVKTRARSKRDFSQPTKANKLNVGKLVVPQETCEMQPHASRFCEIPSGSEDSELSGSDTDDEIGKIVQQDKRHKRRVCEQDDKVTKKVKAYTWKDEKMEKNSADVLFRGPCAIPSLTLQTPADFFKYFFDDQILEMIVKQTLLYAVQTRPEKPLRFSCPDLEQFIGVCMMMSLVKMCSSRKYWSDVFRFAQVAEVMTLNRFEEIKRFIHFNDNSNKSDDRLQKIKPLIEMLRERFNSIPKREHLSIDEQIVPFKGRSSLKQYNPQKPHKWGYKIYVLCDARGYAYDIEVYTGKSNNVLVDGEQDCGVSGNVIVRLSRSIPHGMNHKLYFDNYFTSPQLQVFLAGKGILCLGTVRSNRVPHSITVSDADLKKRGRGSFVEKLAVVDGTEIASVRWFDNKAVHFLSTFTGSEPVHEVRRWNAKEKHYCKIACPDVVKVYNKHMGGLTLWIR